MTGIEGVLSTILGVFFYSVLYGVVMTGIASAVGYESWCERDKSKGKFIAAIGFWVSVYLLYKYG